LGQGQQGDLAVVVPHLHVLLLPQLHQPAEPLVVSEPLGLARLLERDVVDHLVAGGECLVSDDA